MAELARAAWPMRRVAEALEALVVRSGLAAPRGRAAPAARGPTAVRNDELGHFLTAAAAPLAVEVAPVHSTYADLPRVVAGAHPALLRVGDDLVALLRGGRKTAVVLGPDQEQMRVSAADLVAALRGPLEQPITAETDDLVARAGVASRRAARARSVLISERLARQRVDGMWMLRRAPNSRFTEELHDLGVGRALAALVLVYLVQVAASLLSWFTLGRGALAGYRDPGWLAAWALLLATMVPFRLLVTWLQGVLAVQIGGALKRRLLVGALRVAPDSLRSDGAGQMLGRVLESNAVEYLLLSGGLAAGFAALELVVAAAVLASGAGGLLLVLALAGFSGIVVALAWVDFRRQDAWTQARLDATHDLVEAMVGHRTRLQQQAPGEWHDGEDQAVERTVRLAERMDRVSALVSAAPQAWLALAMLALVPAFLATPSRTALAVAVGGILLASSGLGRLAEGALGLGGAAIAWRRVAELFAAARVAEPEGMPEIAVTVGSPETELALEVEGVTYTHAGRSEPVLRGVSLQVRAGDRILIEGPSGSGKSTLAAILSGLRRADEGLVLAGGLDWLTLGVQGWRRRIVAAPQFHENLVVTETLAFNVLLGRGWPPSVEQQAEGLAICKELGLGKLLERMPAGLLQMVGEGGWQLSHGEKSRVFIARALLQGAPVVILDESTGALDPATLGQVMDCVLARAKTLLVIAHP